MVALPNGSNETAEIVADVLSTIGRDDEIASYLIATLKNELDDADTCCNEQLRSRSYG